MYIVNDIENIVLLSNLGIFPHIKSKCGEMSITNVRINDFGISFMNQIRKAINQGLAIKEVDVEYFEFAEKYRTLFRELGDGDISSIYEAVKTQTIIITSDILIISIAKKLEIRYINTEDLVKKYISDAPMIEIFNQLKIA